MSAFKKYSKYYDLVYRDKNYLEEVVYVDRLIKKYNAPGTKLLNFGCGTGKHDFYFAEKKYQVTGVDLSSEMVEEAKQKAVNLKQGPAPQFLQGDITGVRLDDSYDTVISLFHVMSYIVDTNNLQKAIENAYRHLKNDGLFIFDFWYGPGVVTDKPQTRVKRVNTPEEDLCRITTSKIFPNENMVEVSFDFIVKDKIKNELMEFNEKHYVRYFFFPELKYLLEKAGFKEINLLEWLSESKEPDFNTWNGIIICKK